LRQDRLADPQRVMTAPGKRAISLQNSVGEKATMADLRDGLAARLAD
jgi:hypothetical protein